MPEPRAGADESTFVAALLTHPHDEAAWDAFQDHLVRRGDPRGELMRLERALETSPDAALLEAREAHVARHAGELLGELADPHCGVALRFHRGLITSAHLRGGDPSAQLITLSALRTAALLRSLVLEEPQPHALETLVRWAPPLEELRLGVDADAELPAEIWPQLRRCPRLVALDVIGRSDPRAKDLEAPWPWRLERLSFRSTGLSPSILEAILEQTWPALESLWLGIGQSRVSAVTLSTLLRSERFAALSALGICNTTLTNHVARALGTSPLLAQITHLDLWGGTLTDGGAAAIAAHAPAFAHLTQLDARANLLGPLGERYLSSAVPHAFLSDQREGYGRGLRIPAVPHREPIADGEEVRP